METARLLHRLELTTTAACTCGIVASELHLHRKNCHYRIMHHAADAIRSFMNRVGAKVCRCELFDQETIVTALTCCELCTMFEGRDDTKNDAGNGA